MTHNEGWTTPNHGVTHYGELGGYWATINGCDDALVELCKWFPGCGFSPIKEIFESLADAKSAGEAWANQQHKSA